jgi:hypothetical protein
VNRELVPYHEEWIGNDIKLRPTSAYGIRLYLNGSSLVMHYDKVHLILKNHELIITLFYG